MLTGMPTPSSNEMSGAETVAANATLGRSESTISMLNFEIAIEMYIEKMKREKEREKEREKL